MVYEPVYTSCIGPGRRKAGPYRTNTDGRDENPTSLLITFLLTIHCSLFTIH